MITNVGKLYIATHEAGHAVVGLLLGAKLSEVTIVPDEDRGTLGHAVHEYGDCHLSFGGEYWWLMVRAITALAGQAAVVRLGYNDTEKEAWGAENDYFNAVNYLCSITGSDVIELVGKACATARLIVDMAWDSIRTVAQMLINSGSITEVEIREALDLSSMLSVNCSHTSAHHNRL